jgi:tripartite-type tricarboxylate transporter receptor subunit TctC
MKIRIVAATAALASALSLLSNPAPALASEAWPTKPVRIIAPFPPGGSVDQVSRIFAQHLAEPLGQSVVVENRAGASGSIGAAAVASAPPDGHTWLMVFDTHAVNPSVIPNMPFDTRKDLAPVMLIGTSPMALVAHSSQPWSNFADLLAEARKKPGEIPFGSVGSGSLGHLAMVEVGNLAGTGFNHIPYKGGGPLMIDANGGQVPLAIGTVFLVSPHVKAGRVKPLAVTSARASASLPGVKPMAEQGVPGFEALAWWGVLAPAGTPRRIIDRMHAELTKVLAKPEVRERLSSQGMDISGGAPEVFGKFLDSEIDRWAKVVKDNRIQAGK